jgi:hypothetical protein
MWHPVRGTSLGPRVHDFDQPSFATIFKVAEEGVAIYSRLPVLSKYLGHTSVSATQWYLRLSAEVISDRQIAKRNWRNVYNILNLKSGGDSDE